MAELAVILLDDYRQAELDLGFETAFVELSLAADFRPAERILIKPNLLAAVPPEKAATPHPTVFLALIRSLQRLGLALSYGDSPGIDTPARAAKVSGLAAIAAAQNVAAADFASAVNIPVPDGKAIKHLPLARGVAEADGLVSLAKLKTHALTGLTGVLKNQFGVIPGPQKSLYHVNYPGLEDFCQMLVDINRCIKPRLFVLDGIMAMEGNGPRSGRPRRVGAVLLSRDPVAVDAAATYLTGQNPAAVITSLIAARDGLGSLDLAQVQVCLIRPAGGRASCRKGRADLLLADLQVQGFVKARHLHPSVSTATLIGAPLVKRYILMRPVLTADRCTRCGICANVCPAGPKAVRLNSRDRRPEFDYQKCIRCFCCQENCPAGAIAVRRTLFGRLLQT
jgi:uncharacterized protein (DUF362 family)/ferredoxin